MHKNWKKNWLNNKANISFSYSKIEDKNEKAKNGKMRGIKLKIKSEVWPKSLKINKKQRKEKWKFETNIKYQNNNLNNETKSLNFTRL